MAAIAPWSKLTKTYGGKYNFLLWIDWGIHETAWYSHTHNVQWVSNYISKQDIVFPQGRVCLYNARNPILNLVKWISLLRAFHAPLATSLLVTLLKNQTWIGLHLEYQMRKQETKLQVNDLKSLSTIK